MHFAFINLFESKSIGTVSCGVVGWSDPLAGTITCFHTYLDINYFENMVRKTGR